MRRSAVLAAAAALFASAGMVVLSPPAQAATACDGFFSDTTFPGSLVVEGEDVCRLYNVTVGGSITVKPKGVLLIQSGGGGAGGTPSHVFGGISAERAQVYVEDSRVDSSITLQRPRAILIPDVGESAALICGNRIGGSVTVTRTESGEQVDIGGGACVAYKQYSLDGGGGDAGNEIGGSIKLKDNRGTENVDNNFVAGSVKCIDNNPDPNYGPNNVVLGSVSGDCP